MKIKIIFILLYFPAGDCCSCSVGMNEGSDFLKLIYADGTEFLSNDHLREKIASKIESEYFAQTNTDVEHAIVWNSAVPDIKYLTDKF